MGAGSVQRVVSLIWLDGVHSSFGLGVSMREGMSAGSAHMVVLSELWLWVLSRSWLRLLSLLLNTACFANSHGGMTGGCGGGGGFCCRKNSALAVVGFAAKKLCKCSCSVALAVRLS